MDLDAIKDVESNELEILHPLNGKGLGAFVTLAGPEHGERKAMEFARQRRAREELRRTGTLETLAPDEEAQEKLDLLATCVLGWRGFTVGDQDVPYSKEKVREVFGKKELCWMRDQVLARLANRDNFINASAQP